ncbi:MAG TPA: GNAT family N-acetyltransferase [Pedobacter sp.]|jgi:GNAT superfamily N-acetyltransferase
MEYNIRLCEESDLAQLVELCSNHAAYEEAPYSAVRKEELLSAALFADTPKVFCQVVESGENLVGYFSYTFDFSTWDAGTFLHLDCLYLEPEVRGNRIGERIMLVLRDIARKKNCVNIQWQTPVFNERAIKFYNRMGATSKDKVRFTLLL